MKYWIDVLEDGSDSFEELHRSDARAASLMLFDMLYRMVTTPGNKRETESVTIREMTMWQGQQYVLQSYCRQMEPLAITRQFPSEVKEADPELERLLREEDEIRMSREEAEAEEEADAQWRKRLGW